MVTLKEVAAAAKVSTVTASSVLSGVNRVRVSAATAERIHQIAKSMNYVPLAAARGLRTGKTRIIAFVASAKGMFHRDDAWHESLRGVSDLMWEREERLMLVMPHNREHEIEIIRQMAYGRQVDGFVVQDADDDPELMDLLAQSERPFVMMGGVPRPGVNTVAFDIRAFAEQIASILRDGGCGDMLLLLPQSVDDRVFGPFRNHFAAWAAEHGASCDIWRGAFIPDAPWLEKRHAENGGKKLGVALLRGLLPEMVKALDDAGMPLGDGSNIVYVSTGEDIIMAPDGLTVMHYDNYTLGRRAVQVLLKIVDNSNAAMSSENIVIPAAQMG